MVHQNLIAILNDLKPRLDQLQIIPGVIIAWFTNRNIFDRNQTYLITQGMPMEQITKFCDALKAQPDEIFLELQSFCNASGINMTEIGGFIKQRLIDLNRSDLILEHETQVAMHAVNSIPKDSKEKSILTNLKEILRANIRIDCEYIKKYWKDFLESVEMRETFTELEILDHQGGMTGNRVNGYEDIFGNVNRNRRIIIEGDPGTGKSTYLNMLAMDWAGIEGDENGHEFLNKHFDLVLLIALRSLRDTSIELALEIFCEGEEQLLAALIDRMKKPNSRILLLLDAFDEFDEQSSTYQEVMNILSKNKFKHINVVLTTRRSHIHRLPTAARDRWLLLKGFDEDGINTYLAKQGVIADIDNDPQYEMMLPLLETPLFCAIYSILHRQKALELVRDLFDILNAFIEHTINLHFEEKQELFGVASADVWQQSDVYKNLGRYALTCLTSDIQQLVKDSFDVNPQDRHLLEEYIINNCRIGVLCQRRIFSASHRKFSVVLEFPHQTFTEYFAAHCVAETIEKLTGKHKISIKLFCSQFGTFLTGHSKILTEKTLDQWVREDIIRKGQMLLEPARLDYDAANLANKTLSFWLQKFSRTSDPSIISFERDGKICLRIEQTTHCTMNNMVSNLFNDLSVYCKGVIFSTLDTSTLVPRLNLFYDVTKITDAIANKVSDFLIMGDKNFIDTVTHLDLSFCKKINVNAYDNEDPSVCNSNKAEEVIINATTSKCRSSTSMSDISYYDSKAPMDCSQPVENLGCSPIKIAKECEFSEVRNTHVDPLEIGQAYSVSNEFKTQDSSDKSNIRQAIIDQTFKSKSVLKSSCNKAFGPFIKCLESRKLLKSLHSLKLSTIKELNQSPQFFCLLANFEMLEKLDISSCDLSKECVDAFESSIANTTTRLCCTLKELNLSRNEEVGNCSLIFHHLNAYPLNILDVSYCNLSLLSIETFCDTLINRTAPLATSLQSMSLDGNILLAASPSFFEALSALPKLQNLSIGGGCLTSHISNKLIPLNKSIKKLDISFCTEIPPSFFELLGSFSVLEVLKLEDCDVSEESAICLINSLKCGDLKFCLRSFSFVENPELENMPQLYHALVECASLKDIGLEVHDELPERAALRETLRKKLTLQVTVLDVDF